MIRNKTKRRLAMLTAMVFASNAGVAAVATTDADEGNGDKLEEIVVTAQRREERLQNVPMTVSAFSEATLELNNVVDVSDMNILDTALNAEISNGTVLPFLRGVGNPSVVVGNEASVPIYIDGVYIANLSPGYLEFNNIERVEVLKGPQGTLFGRNSTGGLIQIVTRDPTTTPTLDTSITYGNYNDVTAKFYASDGVGPIAGDIALLYNDQGQGWGRDITTGTDIYKGHNLSGRSKWVLEPVDGTKITLSGDYFTYDSSWGIVTNGYRGVVQGNPITGTAYPPLGIYDSRDGYLPADDNNGGGASLQIDQTLPVAQFKSLTAYRVINGLENIDATTSPYPIYNATIDYYVKTVSQEFQLFSLDSSSIKWLGGLYYLHDEAVYNPTGLLGSDFVPTGLEVALNGFELTRSYAAYGQTTVPVGDQADVTLGARYTEDKVGANGVTNVNQFEGPVLIPGKLASASQNFSKLTWHAAFDWHFSNDVLGYISEGRGYKAGVYNIQPFSPDVVQPEVTDSVEIGMKTELLENRLRLNWAAFYNHIRDPQVQIATAEAIALLNAGSARTYGLDLSGDAVVTKNFSLQFGASYLNARYIDFTGAPFYYPNPASPYGNLGTVPGSADGFHMPRAPDLTFNVGGSYNIQTSRGVLALGGNYWHTSRFWWAADNINSEPGYGLLSARVTYKPDASRWTLMVWGANLTGSKYYTDINEEAGPQGTVAIAGAPRTYGGTIEFKY